MEGGKSLELSASWAINQPPSQNGTVLRLHGTGGAVDVYTAQGAVLYRQEKETILPPPKLIHHAAMMRHFKTAISGGIAAQASGAHGVALMKIVEAMYRSVRTGRSVEIK